MTPTKIEIPYNGERFFIDIAEGNTVRLNSVYEIAGSPNNQDPRQWSRLPATKKLMKSINVEKSHILKTQRGVGGGTWAHWQLALSYAQYLSPELHLAVNQVFKERLEETLDPELGITRSRKRAIKRWRKFGMDDTHIETRSKSVDVRNGFTDTLQDHNVSGNGYAICTNNIYRPILGGNAKEIRIEKGLKKNENIRDSISIVELGAIMYAEILATDKIKRENKQGNNQCAIACLKSGMNLKELVDNHEKSITSNNISSTIPIKSGKDILITKIQKIQERSKNL